MSHTPNHIFSRSGIAALSDLESAECLELFRLLEIDQERFSEKQVLFRSPQYMWPKDPLHTWSRVWEYPYVYYHLKCLKERSASVSLPRVVDLGSGVTFFPFSISRLGYSVTCTDTDPICAVDLPRAIKNLAHEPGEINFRLVKGPTLPFEDGEADVLYCISVLEHIASFEKTLAEVARILRPGGLLLLTVDLDLRGDAELSVKNHRQLTKELCDNFEYIYQETTTHPSDVLHSANGPFAIERPKGRQLLKFVLRQYIANTLLGRKPRPIIPFHLAVQGWAMTRRGR